LQTLDLPKEFARVVESQSVNFVARGILAADDRVFTLGTDTKVLSTIFELFCRPVVAEIAEKANLKVEESPQTVYPDFTLHEGVGDNKKIAIDIKTTYRRPAISFTLGSYTSFLRNGTKNILYPYDQYSAHWVIGFVYSRPLEIAPSIFPLGEAHTIPPPYGKVEWFVQQKHKIAADVPGSGNTANIASLRSQDIDDFRAGKGPFANEGEKVFRDYWANYEKGTKSPYKSLAGYKQVRGSAIMRTSLDDFFDSAYLWAT
jgi:hypothetical protein